MPHGVPNILGPLCAAPLSATASIIPPFRSSTKPDSFATRTMQCAPRFAALLAVFGIEDIMYHMWPRQGISILQDAIRALQFNGSAACGARSGERLLVLLEQRFSLSGSTRPQPTACRLLSDAFERDSRGNISSPFGKGGEGDLKRRPRLCNSWSCRLLAPPPRSENHP
jgi:hypothetical protein